MSKQTPLTTRIRTATRILLKGIDAPTARAPLAPLTDEEVADAKSFFPLEKYFIFGHARSGTTLLARLIRLHPQVHCNWQAQFFGRPPLLISLTASPEVEKWLAHRSNRWNHGRDLSPIILRAAADFIMERDARREGKTIVGDKSPNNILNGQTVINAHDLYPDARIINIVRDGRDTLISHQFQSFTQDAEWLTPGERSIRADFMKDSSAFADGKRSIFTEEGIRKAAAGWTANVTETDREGKRLYADRFLSLRYEDLLAGPWTEMYRIWSFLGVKDIPATLEQDIHSAMETNTDANWVEQKNETIARAIPRGKKGNWQNLFTARDRQIFKEKAGQTLIDWGYEKGLDW